MSTTDQVTRALADHLMPGERVLAATKGHLDGGSVRLAGAFAVGGMAAAGILAEVGDDLDRRLAGGAAVAVTDQRVVVLDVTKMGANPKDPVLFIDRGHIADVVSGSKRIMLVKVPTFGFTASAPDGESFTLRFEVAKVQTRDATAVIAALQGCR